MHWLFVETYEDFVTTHLQDGLIGHEGCAGAADI